MPNSGKTGSVPQDKTIELPTTTVEGLVENLLKGQHVSTSFKNAFIREFKIEGKTLLEWKKEFSIKVPPDLDPERCKELDLDILSKLDRAFYYFAISDAVLTALQDGLNSNTRERYEIMVRKYTERTGKQPSAAVLGEFRKQADDPGLSTSVANARITRDFFKSLIDHLTACRKIIENAAVINGTIAKLTQSAY